MNTCGKCCDMNDLVNDMFRYVNENSRVFTDFQKDWGSDKTMGSVKGYDLDKLNEMFVLGQLKILTKIADEIQLRWGKR